MGPDRVGASVAPVPGAGVAVPWPPAPVVGSPHVQLDRWPLAVSARPTGGAGVASGVVVAKDAAPASGVAMVEDAAPASGVAIVEDAEPASGVAIVEDAEPASGVEFAGDATVAGGDAGTAACPADALQGAQSMASSVSAGAHAE